VLTGDHLWPQETGALADICGEVESLTTVINYFGSGEEEHFGLPYRIYVTLSPESQPLDSLPIEFPDHILLRSDPIDVALGDPLSVCDYCECIPSLHGTVTDFTSDEGIRRIPSSGVSAFLHPPEDPSVLRVQWANIADQTFYSVQMLDPVSLRPCQKIRIDLEALTDQAIRIELKTGDHTHPEDFVRREVHRFIAGQRREVDIEATREFDLNDVTFAMEGRQQEDGISSGTFLVHSITICGESR
jgi:hypothetical protein